MSEKIIRRYDEDKIMMTGKPFLISLATTAGSLAVSTFTLDTTTYDVNGDGVSVGEIPFNGMELYITGIRIVNAGAAQVFGRLIIDDTLVLSGSTLAADTGYIQHAANEEIPLDGFNKAFGAVGTDIIAPNVVQMFGTPALICRSHISIYAAATAGGQSTTVWFVGWDVPRKM